MVLVTSRNIKYTLSTLLVSSRVRWGLILGCTNEGIFMWHRNHWRVWFPTVKIVLALVLALALFNTSWSCQNLSLRGSSFCLGSPSWIKFLLVTWWIFLLVPLYSHIITSMPIYDMVSIGFGFTLSGIYWRRYCLDIFSHIKFSWYIRGIPLKLTELYWCLWKCTR